MMETKYPEIEVQLIGRDGNAFGIIGAVQKALRRGLVREYGFTSEDARAEANRVASEMMDGDYDHLLRVAVETVSVS